MSRLEPNQLLALSTGFALIVLVLSAVANGPEGTVLRYPILAVVCSLGYVVLNGLWSRRMKLNRPPMIHPDAPGTAVWASLFPMLLLFGSIIPVLFPDRDLGLLVIVAAIWFGLTMESAFKAARRDG
ncbi:hypothetical protein [Brevundimonas balnearis]|uniref:Cationic amino acid transporter C-terminal domain-containing protein n=1 Tax=Brevundimonas balnearis TaxID=1572858 RepID=A0ABV6QZC1_9CAUL